MTILLLASCAAFAGAFLSACIGLGGGTLFIACLYLVFEPLEAIALHGLIQTGTTFDFSRPTGCCLHCDSTFHDGSIASGCVGLGVAGDARQHSFARLTGRFRSAQSHDLSLSSNDPDSRLVRHWVRRDRSSWSYKIQHLPFFLGKRFERRQIIATKAACQLATHLPKVALFALLGFEGQDPFPYQDYTGVLAAMLLSVLLGVMIGKKTQVNPSVFRRLYRGTLLILGLKLLVWDALLAG